MHVVHIILSDFKGFLKTNYKEPYFPGEPIILKSTNQLKIMQFCTTYVIISNIDSYKKYLLLCYWMLYFSMWGHYGHKNFCKCSIPSEKFWPNFQIKSIISCRENGFFLFFQQLFCSLANPECF